MHASAPRILRAADGLVMGDPAGVRDRFLIDGDDAGGRFALVQHLSTPRALAAPLHRHHQEDEYMYVVYGRVGAVLGDDEVVGEPGDLIFKPRDQWHTFWNAGDGPAAVLELISPAGLEQFSRWLDGLAEPPTPQQLAGMATPYDCDADPEGTRCIIERHGLTF
jgi:mannose-6-phosphate isomerase-like protein (cupin superfamily)